MPEIRLALVRLNGLDMSKLADGVSTSTLYNTLKGVRSNRIARDKLAEALGLKKEELFPEMEEETGPEDRIPRGRRQESGLRSAPRGP